MATDFERILVGVDDSPDALAALTYAIHRAKADEAELIIASVLEAGEMNIYQALTKDYVHGERQALEAHLQEYVDLAQKAGIKSVRAAVSEGHPGEEIVKHIIPAMKPDLLIIGAAAKTGIANLLGSQAVYMVKHARISVLVIRD